jgi:hypothetical protein
MGAVHTMGLDIGRVGRWTDGQVGRRTGRQTANGPGGTAGRAGGQVVIAVTYGSRVCIFAKVLKNRSTPRSIGGKVIWSGGRGLRLPMAVVGDPGVGRSTPSGGLPMKQCIKKTTCWNP